MDALIILAVIAGLPLLLALFLRVSAVFLFTSVAAGGLLVNYIGDDAALALGMFVRGANSNLFAHIGLLLIPVLLSLLFLRGTLPKSKVLLHLPVLAVIGLALATLILPLLDANVQEKIYSNNYGLQLREAQDVVISIAAISVMLLMWMTYRHKEGKKHKKGNH